VSGGPSVVAPARRKVIALSALLTLVLLAGFVAKAPTARAGNVSLHLYGRYSSPTGWSLASGGETDPGPALSVNRGDHVTLQLTSDDGSYHIFWLDYNRYGQPQGNEPQSAQFTSGTTYVFDANQAGTFNYWCLVHKPAMRGTWMTNATSGTIPPTVSAVSATPATAPPGAVVSIAATVAGSAAITNVTAHIIGPTFDENLTMTRFGADRFFLNRTYPVSGMYSFTVWAQDGAGNFGSGSGSFAIARATPLGLTEWLIVIVGSLTLIAVAVTFYFVVRKRRRPPGT